MHYNKFFQLLQHFFDNFIYKNMTYIKKTSNFEKGVKTLPLKQNENTNKIMPCTLHGTTSFAPNITTWSNKHIHFVGVGGISMSALAELCVSFGMVVSGSDIVKNTQTKKLENLGVKVFTSHQASNISKSIDMVVYTGAIANENAELMYAKAQSIPILERSEFLGKICERYKKVIAISGTHGKTTTTAIVGEIFNTAGKNPTIHIGGMAQFGNLQIGGRDFFITEACEYLNSFSYINSTTAVITNIDADHLDYYKNKQNLREAFQNFASNASENIILFENKELAFKSAGRHVYTCGLSSSFDCYASNIVEISEGYQFDVTFLKEKLGNFTIKVFGYHNIKNALCAVAIAHLHGIGKEAIKKGLYNYSGVERRYEKIGKIKNTFVIADYAHHPTEIETSLDGYKDKKVLAVFQPHTYSRTKTLLDNFKDCFKCQTIAIFPTYPAREKADIKGDEKALFKAISNQNKIALNTKEELRVFLKNNAKYYDIVLILGAGDIYDIVKNMFKLKEFLI